MAYFRRSVTLNQEQKPLLDALVAAMPKLGKGDQSFAASLVNNFNSWGKLSDKQMIWVDTLTQRANNPTPQVPVQQVNVSRIQDMFANAGQKLKRVKVRLQTVSGQAVVFSLAGSMSKYAGQIMITDGGPFGQNKFFGRIDVNGDYYATRSSGQEVMDLITEFAAAPEETAGKYGRLTGGCCFCNHSLKDNRSLALGYGPVCADRFGLAH